MSTTLYELIGGSPTASAAEVEAACVRFGERYRPDKNPGDANAARRFALFEEAFTTLTDPAKRAAYDESIGVKGNAGEVLSSSATPQQMTPDSFDNRAANTRDVVARRVPRRWIAYGAVASLLALVVLAVVFYAIREREAAELARQEVSEKARQAEIALACVASAKELRASYARWEDAVALAASTQRIALAERVAVLQKLRQDVNFLSVPQCANKARELLSLYMESKINRFLTFLSEDPESFPSEPHETERDLIWEHGLELRGLEGGCDDICKEKAVAERKRMKVLAEIKRKEDEARAAIQRDRAQREYALASEKRQIDSALARVRDGLHDPSSARFEGVIYSRGNGAVCGQVIARNGRGAYVRESFAVGGWTVTIGYELRTGVNVGAIAAKRLCG